MRPFALTQPTISKHLTVLERAGLVMCKRDAQRRPRTLVAVPLEDLADWIEPFRRFSEQRFDGLRGIKKLALYEAPFIVDGTRSTTEDDWDQVGAAIAAGRRSDPVKLFLKLVGVPGFLRALMPPMLPVWSKLKAVAHTLPYDGAIVRDNQKGKPLPASKWSSVTIPALVMDGGKSPAWMRHANRALASVLPNAHYRTLEGETHMLKPKVHLPMLVAFFKAG
jgi:hypothetical protein